MRWIDQLYPKEHFYFPNAPLSWRSLADWAKLGLRFLTQTVVLVGLTLIYFFVLGPIRFFLLVRQERLLSLKPEKSKVSYLEDPAEKNVNFKRMF